MKKALLVLLLTISPAFADDQNVYDFFRQMEPKSNTAALDEEVTARIKRHMANLLYPVEMTSFARPHKDAKFREQIMALQKQMGVPATGTLTSLIGQRKPLTILMIASLRLRMVDRLADGEAGLREPFPIHVVVFNAERRDRIDVDQWRK